MSNRSFGIDILKGIAIAAVVLFHFGVFPRGYLGVDIFLVLAGYFTAASLWKRPIGRLRDGLRFIGGRLWRLLPPLLVGAAVALAVGMLLMMPDDLENLAQSVLASNFFANNILASLTTKDYWATANEYRPLMHTWYLGVLVQFYLLAVLLDLGLNKLRRPSLRTCSVVWASLSAASLLLYLCGFSRGITYYHLPFRIFEFGIGSLLFYARTAFGFKIPFRLPKNKFTRALAALGAASLSIYVWHQIVLAFIRYSFVNVDVSTSIIMLALLLPLIALLAYLSYRYIEPIKRTTRNIWLVLVGFILLSAGALVLYLRAGVFYSVPELEVDVHNVHRGMWAEYCDRGWKYYREFQPTDKPRWVVVGDSYGRDFINVILESPIADKVDIYFAPDHSDEDNIARIKGADMLIVAYSNMDIKLASYVLAFKSRHSDYRVVGDKQIAASMGRFYRQRYSPDYHSLTAYYPRYSSLRRENDWMRARFGDKFIDVMQLLEMDKERVAVFSPDGRYLSHDGRHLTRAGAQFLASKIDWDPRLWGLESKPAEHNSLPAE